MTAPFDTLKLSRQLRERAHFDQEQAGPCGIIEMGLAALPHRPKRFDATKNHAKCSVDFAKKIRSLSKRTSSPGAYSSR
jgi:hypothetical protein